MEIQVQNICSLCLKYSNSRLNYNTSYNLDSDFLENHKEPFIYSYDFMMNSNSNNYITYCNLSGRDQRYVQVINQNTLQRSFSMNTPYVCTEVTYDSINPNNTEVLLCTCHEFINHTMQNGSVAKDKHVARLPQSPLPIESIASIDSRERSIDELQENSIYSNGSLLSDPMCRFCHISKSTSSDQLISPCLCSGTLKLVHQSCLKIWLDVSKKQRENNPGDKTPHCELCNFKYIRKRKFQFRKLRYPKLSQNDCALHLIFLCSLLVMLTSASVTILCFAMEKSGSTANRPQIYGKSSNSVTNTDKSLPQADLLPTHTVNRGPQPLPPPPPPNNICNNLRRKLSFNGQSQQSGSSNAHINVAEFRRLCQHSKDTENFHNRVRAPTLQQQPPNHQQRRRYSSRLFLNMNPPSSGTHQQQQQQQSHLWILSPEEAVTLASGVIFFIAFFIAMVVQVKSSYTCYQLLMQWLRLNYTYEVQPLRPARPQPPPPLLASVVSGDAGLGQTPLQDFSALRACTGRHHRKTLANTNSQSSSDQQQPPPREFIERCVTEI